MGILVIVFSSQVTNAAKLQPDLEPFLGRAKGGKIMGIIIYVALLLLRLSWEAAFPRLRWRRFPFSDRAAWGVVAGLLAFAILRNLPWWPLTLLAPP